MAAPLARLLLDPRHWPLALACGAGWLAIRCLPRRALGVIGRTIGRLAARLSSERRLVAETNLRLCFPALDDAARERLLRANFEATGMALLESALALWGTDRRLERWTQVEGFEHFRAAQEAGKGVLVLMAHYTPVELACRLANLHAEPPIVLLGRRHNSPLLDAVIERARRRHAGETLEKKDLRGLIRSLRDNRAVFYAPDQNFSYQSVFVPFFGVTAATVTATADLVRRTGAAVVPLWCRRLPGGDYRLRFEPSWQDFPSGDAPADAARVNRWVEQHVRECPEQYLWVHRRFKTRRKGEAPVYPEQARRPKDR